MSETVILTDVDGVLLNWFHSFNRWMELRGFKAQETENYCIGETYKISPKEKSLLTRQFNESCWIRHIPPFRDAVKYVKKLHEEHGFVFHCITSLSLDEYAYQARKENLSNIFGNTAIEKLICLDTGADKHTALEKYKDSGYWWVEDKIENCDLGIEYGLHGILMQHGHNTKYTGSAYRVKNWNQIYDIVTN